MAEDEKAAPPEPQLSNEWIEIGGVPVNVPLEHVVAGRPAVAAWERSHPNYVAPFAQPAAVTQDNADHDGRE